MFIGAWDGGYIVTPQAARRYGKRLLAASANLNAVWAVGEDMAPQLRKDAIVVIKSTVPVGTNRELMERMSKKANRPKIGRAHV